VFLLTIGLSLAILKKIYRNYLIYGKKEVYESNNIGRGVVAQE
jgi:hypothetical protein